MPRSTFSLSPEVFQSSDVRKGTIYAPGDVPAAPLVRRSARLVAEPVPASCPLSINEAVQARLSWAPVDGEPLEQSTSASSKKRGQGVTPASEEVAFSPSEEADDSDDEFRESRPTKKPRLVLSAPKPPTTTQGVPATTQGPAPKAP